MFLGVRNLIMRFPKEEGGEAGGQTPPAEEKGGQKPQEDNDKVALAKALKEARENSVSKEEYEKVKAENKRLVSEIINGEGSADGGQQPASEEKDLDTRIQELRNDLYGSKSSELSNLDYWKKTLELRDTVIKKGDPDPFLPVGAKISPDEDDVVKANNVADVVGQCIEEADGNSEVFTALLQSRMNNDSPQLVLRLKKLGIKF